MAIRQSGWNPKKTVTDIEKKVLNSPQKIENAENDLRKWPTWIDNNAKRLNDTENMTGIAPIKKKRNVTVNELLNYRTKKR